jgi:hypothetical protein
MENEKEKENTTNSILNEEFFNTIRLSKKINAKIKKMILLISQKNKKIK